MKRSPMRSRSRNIRPKMVVSAQQAVNQYIRVRDRNQPCISCDEHTELQAGHYLTRPELRFIPENIHGQCRHCNIDLAGNRTAYRIGLIARYGLAYVEALECFVSNGKNSLDDLQNIVKMYNAMSKEESGVWE